MILATFATPVPHVGITMDGFSGTSTVKLWREWDGGRAVVRGTDGLVVVGSDYVIDWEAPLNVATTYRIETVSGSAPTTESGSVTLTSDTGWLSDPLDPTTGVPVSSLSQDDTWLTSGALASWEYPDLGGIVRVLGDRIPVSFGPGAGAPVNAPLHMITETAAATTALANLLDSDVPQFLIRALPAWNPLPSVGYWRVTRTRIPINAYIGGTLWKWELTGTQVRPQTLKIAVPLWTYDDVATLRTGLTYADVQTVATAGGVTYTDDKADPQMGA